MESERKLNLIYFVLGLAAGVVSAKLEPSTAVVVAGVVYLTSFLSIRFLVKEKKKFSWLLANTLVTFLLVWAIAWVLISNSGWSY
ncbi:MAG: hypothetical protein HYW24_04395 [Candidatus Aenigmarchaeota archaeon]|nr:hypothetical protein [Candidatus Aenigmarchaeota archaeon]